MAAAGESSARAAAQLDCSTPALFNAWRACLLPPDGPPRGSAGAAKLEMAREDAFRLVKTAHPLLRRDSLISLSYDAAASQFTFTGVDGARLLVLPREVADLWTFCAALFVYLRKAKHDGVVTPSAVVDELKRHDVLCGRQATGSLTLASIAGALALGDDGADGGASHGGAPRMAYVLAGLPAALARTLERPYLSAYMTSLPRVWDVVAWDAAARRAHVERLSLARSGIRAFGAAYEAASARATAEVCAAPAAAAALAGFSEATAAAATAPGGASGPAASGVGGGAPSSVVVPLSDVSGYLNALQSADGTEIAVDRVTLARTAVLIAFKCWLAGGGTGADHSRGAPPRPSASSASAVERSAAATQALRNDVVSAVHAGMVRCPHNVVVEVFYSPRVTFAIIYVGGQHNHALGTPEVGRSLSRHELTEKFVEGIPGVVNVMDVSAFDVRVKDNVAADRRRWLDGGVVVGLRPSGVGSVLMVSPTPDRYGGHGLGADRRGPRGLHGHHVANSARASSASLGSALADDDGGASLIPCALGSTFCSCSAPVATFTGSADADGDDGGGLCFCTAATSLRRACVAGSVFHRRCEDVPRDCDLAEWTCRTCTRLAGARVSASIPLPRSPAPSAVLEDEGEAGAAGCGTEGGGDGKGVGAHGGAGAPHDGTGAGIRDGADARAAPPDVPLDRAVRTRRPPPPKDLDYSRPLTAALPPIRQVSAEPDPATMMTHAERASHPLASLIPSASPPAAPSAAVADAAAALIALAPAAAAGGAGTLPGVASASASATAPVQHSGATPAAAPPLVGEASVPEARPPRSSAPSFAELARRFAGLFPRYSAYNFSEWDAAKLIDFANHLERRDRGGARVASHLVTELTTRFLAQVNVALDPDVAALVVASAEAMRRHAEQHGIAALLGASAAPCTSAASNAAAALGTAPGEGHRSMRGSTTFPWATTLSPELGDDGRVVGLTSFIMTPDQVRLLQQHPAMLRVLVFDDTYGLSVYSVNLFVFVATDPTSHVNVAAAYLLYMSPHADAVATVDEDGVRTASEAAVGAKTRALQWAFEQFRLRGFSPWTVANFDKDAASFAAFLQQCKHELTVPDIVGPDGGGGYRVAAPR